MKNKNSNDEVNLNYEERISGLLKIKFRHEETIERLSKELEESREKYATLLKKYIDMMERCAGVIPKIRRPEE